MQKNCVYGTVDVLLVQCITIIILHVCEKFIMKMSCIVGLCHKMSKS